MNHPRSAARFSFKSTSTALACLLLLGLAVLYMSSLDHRAGAATWSSAGNMPVDVHSARATLLADGRVLVTGGFNASGIRNEASIYDPGSNSWSAAPPMDDERWAHTATLLPDGRVLVFGGSTTYTIGTGYAELYDPVANSWTAATGLGDGRMGHTATLLADGRVLVAGGTQGNTTHENSFIFDSVQNAWSYAGDMSTSRDGHTATRLLDGRVLVAGGATGYSCCGTLSAVEIYDPVGNSWTVAASMSQSRYSPEATLLADGRVLITGGSNYQGSATYATAEIYDPTTGTWSAAANMPGPLTGHTAALLSDGTVLVAGGGDSHGFGPGNLPGSLAFNSAQTYDPIANTWTTRGPMTEARNRAASARLNDGSVLIAGGSGGGAPSNYLSSAERLIGTFATPTPTASPTPTPTGPPTFTPTPSPSPTPTPTASPTPTPSPTPSPTPTPDPCPAGANTCVGAGVTVSTPGGGKFVPGGVDVTFSQVFGPGVTTITPIAGPGPPFQVAGTSPMPFYDISTTATNLGTITICIGYNELQLTVPENQVQLMHWNGSSYQNITNSRNQVLNFVCGITTSLSPFVLVEGPPVVGGFVELQGPAASGDSDSGWLALAGVAMVAALAIGVSTMRRWLR